MGTDLFLILVGLTVSLRVLIGAYRWSASHEQPLHPPRLVQGRTCCQVRRNGHRPGGFRSEGGNSRPGLSDLEHRHGHRRGADLGHDRSESGPGGRGRIPGVQAHPSGHALSVSLGIFSSVVLITGGEVSARKLAVSVDYSYFSGNTTGTYPPYTTKKINVLSNRDTLILTVFQNGLKDDVSGRTILQYNSCVDNGISLQSPISAALLNGYVSKNCYNKTSPWQCYGRFIPHASRLYCIPENGGSSHCNVRTVMSGSSTYKWPGSVSTNYHDIYAPNGGNFRCGDHVSQSFGFPGWYIMTQVSANVDTCAFTSRKECQMCAYPYVSKADSLGCGCLVDYSKVMPDSLLKFYAYAYCNSVSGSTQYYLDYSRSNFDPSSGPIEVACSSPETRDTKYMPAFTCPAGSRLDTAIADSTARPYTGVPRPSSTGADTGSSGNGSGSDSATHSRLDSILYGYTPAGDSVDSILGRYANAVDSAIASVQGGIDSLEALGTFHGTRYDTTSVEGVSLDSLLNICWTFDHERKCISDTEHYSVLVTWFKWIRRFYMILWGFMCAWIFFKLATYKAD